MQTEKQNPAAVSGASGAAGRQASEVNPTALGQFVRLLPLVVLEVRVALDVARDLHYTGGCSIDDGRRLATAYKRLKTAARMVADAEREVAA